jgi:hypothetical protein
MRWRLPKDRSQPESPPENKRNSQPPSISREADVLDIPFRVFQSAFSRKILNGYISPSDLKICRDKGRNRSRPLFPYISGSHTIVRLRCHPDESPRIINRRPLQCARRAYLQSSTAEIKSDCPNKDGIGRPLRLGWASRCRNIRNRFHYKPKPVSMFSASVRMASTYLGLCIPKLPSLST